MSRGKIDKRWYWAAALFAVAAIVKLIATIRFGNHADELADYLVCASLGATAVLLAMRARNGA